MDDPMLFPENLEDLTEAEVAELEFALYESLHAVDAPAGFAERLLAKAAAVGPVALPQPVTHTVAKPRAKILSFPGSFRTLRSLPAMGAIAAGLLVAAFTGYDLHERRAEVQRAAAATQQFDQATEITDSAIERAQEHAREQMQRAHVPQDALQ